MNIIEFALKMELDGRDFYKRQAAAEPDPELKRILETLAEEEEQHYRFFLTFKDNPDQQPPADSFGTPGAVDRVKNIFEEMSQQSGAKKFGDKAVSVWREALRIEERAVDFYRTRAAEETNADRKRLLARLADEETKHVHMIDGVLMYLKDPATFAASAQFRSFQSLEGR